MNLNHEEEDSVFNQHCLELAKLLRTEQTEDFLHLYDSLPSEWNGSRLDTAKEYIRQLQELDEHEFELLYQRVFHNSKGKQEKSNNSMSQLSIESSIIQNDDELIHNRLTSLSHIKQNQHIEKPTNNNPVDDDDKYDESLKSFSSIKKTTNETSTKTRRVQPVTNSNNTNIMTHNNYRTRTSFDTFAQLNLTPSIDITLEEYKKTKAPMSSSKTINTNSRTCLSQANDNLNSSNANPKNILKKPKSSMTTKSHEEASFDYFFKPEEDVREQSRSSSSSPSSTTNRSVKLNINKNDVTINQTKTFEHSKLIPNNDFDSHGSSVATKSSSENSGSGRTGSASDSDDDHKNVSFPSTKKLSQSSKAKSLYYDDTPTIVLNKTSDYRTSQHDRISSLPSQTSYELVQMNSNDNSHLLASQVPRFKLSAIDDSNVINNPTSDVLSYTAQRPQLNNFTLSSHPNRNPDHQEHHNTNHSNSSRKTSSRSNKKRKQLQQQEIIRTELIPGHRGDLDVDELVMFIDGNSTTKEKQRHNSVPLRLTDTNSNTNPNNASTSRRKSRKPIKIARESINNNENKTIQVDEDVQSFDDIDDDDERTTSTTTTSHSVNNTINTSLPHGDDESHSNTIDIDSTNDSNTTNGETSLASDWLEPMRSTSSVNDDDENELLSSPTKLNNSNSETIYEPFVTVTHRRRLIKERRQDNNSSLSKRSSRLPLSSNTNEKRRFQSSIQNGITRPTVRNSLSNIKPFVTTTTTTISAMTVKEESKTTDSSSLLPLPSPTVSQPPIQSPSQAPPVSNPVIEQSSPRLSSHSSSSSLPSLTKRQSKPPPVVFLNKSIDIALTDFSFGFDFENPSSSSSVDKAKTPTPPPPSEPPTESNEKEPQIQSNTSSSSSPPPSTQANDLSVNSKPSSRRSYQQYPRNSRGLLFYSGSDIRPQQHHKNYPSQAIIQQPPYIDPLSYLQYNQQRFPANYSQPLTYMNLLRAQYLSSQSPYVLISTGYTSVNDVNQDEKILDDESSQTSDHVQEPVLVYATLPTPNGSVYMHPTKKSYYDLEQIQTSTVYPPQYYYLPQTQHVIPSSTAYFQPISSPSLLVDSKSQHDDTDDEYDNDYEKSERLFNQTQQQSSSHIMSNALQLVYSREKRHVQTDSFNLEQLTSYLAMKWTDNVNHYEQGDDEILLVGE